MRAQTFSGKSGFALGQRLGFCIYGCYHSAQFTDQLMEVLLPSSRMSRNATKIILSSIVLVFLLASPMVAQEGNDPSSRAVAFFNSGQDAHEKNDLKTAIDNYEKALKVLAEFPEAELQRGNAY